MSDFSRYRPASTPAGAVMLSSDDGEWIKLREAYAASRKLREQLAASEARCADLRELLAEARRDVENADWIMRGPEAPRPHGCLLDRIDAALAAKGSA